MDFEFRSGARTEKVVVPDQNLLGVLEAPKLEPFQDTESELDQAAQAAARFLEGHPRILALVNDYTRPTPTARFLAALEPAFENKEPHFLVCLGTHRPPTDEEAESIFGSEFFARHRSTISFHDCHDKAKLCFAGKTGFGTEVWFNRQLLWADCIVTLNSIEPHYFAGFTGGRKGFLPGVAGFDTIWQNHNMVTHPNSATFRLEGNPVHEDMVQASRMLSKPVFSIQVVQSHDKRLLSIHYGDLSASFAAGTSDAYQAYALPVRERADIVLSVLQPPYDINFYQAQRAVEFARPALKSPAVQITVSACRDGVGDDGFIQAFRGCSSPSDVLKQAPVAHQVGVARRGDVGRSGWHKSARLAQIMKDADLYCVLGVDDQVVRQAFMHPFQSVQEALDAAIRRRGSKSKVYVIPDAAAVVPVVRD